MRIHPRRDSVASTLALTLIAVFIWLGDQERDLHAGGLVFIPANTWISLKNIGSEAMSLTFIFSAPGFEDTMRCNSVPAGETPTSITPEQQEDCARLGHAERAGSQEQPKM